MSKAIEIRAEEGTCPSRGPTYHVLVDGKTLYYGIDRDWALRIYHRHGGTDQREIDHATREAEAYHERRR